MLRMKIVSAFVLAVSLTVIAPFPPTLAQTAPSVEEIHNELRALKNRVVDAANKQDMDALAQDMAPDAVFTTMTNDVLKGPEALKAYMTKLFTGSSRLVDSMSATAEADDLSKLYADNRIAVATGSANAHFKLPIGKELDWPVRWSAILVRDNDRWLIANAHFSANAISNPLVSAASGIQKWLPWGTGLLGLIVGILLARFMRRGART